MTPQYKDLANVSYTLEDCAKRIRAKCVQMSHDSGEGHLNGALSCVDILVALHKRFLRPWDRFYFSKGHCCSALYATYAEMGYIPSEWLDTYATPGSPLTPHPDIQMFPLLGMSAGSLGHGLGIAAGAAYALKLQGNQKQQGSVARCVVLMGDGECNEGSVWEAAQFAKAQNLDNLIVIVDYNQIQSVGKTDDIAGDTCLVAKFRAFGWESRYVDGHNFQELINTLTINPYPTGLPFAMIALTVSGKGVSFMEGNDSSLWHYKIPNDEEVCLALEELNA